MYVEYYIMQPESLATGYCLVTLNIDTYYSVETKFDDFYSISYLKKICTLNEMGSHWVHTLLDLLYVLYWPDDGPLRSKHVA